MRCDFAEMEEWTLVGVRLYHRLIPFKDGDSCFDVIKIHAGWCEEHCRGNFSFSLGPSGFEAVFDHPDDAFQYRVRWE